MPHWNGQLAWLEHCITIPRQTASGRRHLHSSSFYCAIPLFHTTSSKGLPSLHSQHLSVATTSSLPSFGQPFGLLPTMFPIMAVFSTYPDSFSQHGQLVVVSSVSCTLFTHWNNTKHTDYLPHTISVQGAQNVPQDAFRFLQTFQNSLG